MKKIVIGFIAVASIIFSANAQETRKMKHHHSRHGKEMMLKQINLSAAQKEQLKASRENIKAQMAELNKNENITVKEYKARKEAILKSQKTAMEQVLTPEQKSLLAKNKLEFKAKRQLHAAERLDKMKTSLGLSEDQVAKIKSSREASHAKALAIKENSQLSQTEKKEQLMALKEEQKNSFKQLLTPEQNAKLEERKKARMEKTTKK